MLAVIFALVNIYVRFFPFAEVMGKVKLCPQESWESDLIFPFAFLVLSVSTSLVPTAVISHPVHCSCVTKLSISKLVFLQ